MRAHGRSALATLFAFGCVGGALLGPLQAMRAWLPSATPKMHGPQISSGRATPPAGTALASRRAPDGTWRSYFPAPAAAGRDVVAHARALLSRDAIALAASDLECTGVRQSPSGAHVRFQQWHAGVRVHGGEAVVSFDREARPALVASDLMMVEAAAEKPAIDRDTAESSVEALLDGRVRAAPPAELFWRRFGDRWCLAWRVRRPSGDPVRDWEVWVAANDGAVLERRDRCVHANGTARVFRPDPVLVTGDRTLVDGDDADAAVPASAYDEVTLHDLDPPVRGWYRLSGPHARLRDWESPAGLPDSSLTTDFRRSRAAAGFEDAMVYWHLDAMQRWYQELGFLDANRRQQIADAHGVRGYDNSRFVPTLHWLSFGEGGVDDAEDAGVIVHEYGHATQFDLVPTWGTGGHTGAMGEGFGDYLAYSCLFARDPARAQQWNGVFWWDGHNAFWPGRPARDPALVYPRDANLEVHRSGTLWCGALTDALHAIGDRAVVDRLVLDHHYSLTGAASMEDAANAILASDVAMHRGAHVAVLAAVFARWGILGEFAPVVLQHAPLDARHAHDGDPVFEVRAIATVAALDAASVAVQVRWAGGAWSRLALAPTSDDHFAATWPLPATGDAVLEYFVEARDTAGNTSRSPSGNAVYRVPIGLHCERFESDSGWSVGIDGDGATNGRWARVAPIGTTVQPPTDHTTLGSYCFVTANVQAGAPASDGDVDGGRTTLVSPLYDLQGATPATLEYWRWFACDSNGEDFWRVEASPDGGRSWSLVEESRISEPAWRRIEVDLGTGLGAIETLRLRFAAADDGEPSLVEAALDDVVLRARTITTAADPSPARFLRVASPAAAPVRIQYAIAQASPVRLTVVDVRGRSIRTLVAGRQAAGSHLLLWDGADASGRRVARGVYFLQLASADGIRTTKLVLQAAR